MKKLIAILMLVAFFSLTAITHNEPAKSSTPAPVQITVVDEVTGEALAGVEVNSGVDKVYTDFDGQVTIIPGDSLTFKYISYQALTVDSVPNKVELKSVK